jgi:hypothetical protein
LVHLLLFSPGDVTVIAIIKVLSLGRAAESDDISKLREDRIRFYFLILRHWSRFFTGKRVSIRLRMDEINEGELNKALDGFYKENSRLKTKKIARAVLNEAEHLVNRVGRTLG